MAFEFDGKYGNEAFDAETGMHIKSLGARGPEIERHFWQVDASGQRFQFETLVLSSSADGRYSVLLTPDRSFVEHINDPSLPAENRKGIVKAVIDGLYFIFPTYFRAAIFFKKGNPPPFFGDHGLWDEAELSR